MTRLVVLSCLLVAANSRAQTSIPWARDAALSGAGVAAAHPFGPSPATGPSETGLSLGMAVLYGLPELAPISVGLGLRSPFPITVAAQGLTIEGYSRHSLTLRSARTVGRDEFVAGVSVVSVQERAGDLAPTRGIVLGLAARIRLTRDLWLGAHHDHVVATGNRSNPGAVTVGGAWSLSPELGILVDMRHTRALQPDLLVGCEWRAIPVLDLRWGWSSITQRVSVGIGFFAGRVSVDLAAVDHDPLGWSWLVALRLAKAP